MFTQPPLVARDEAGREDAHEAGQHHERRLVAVDGERERGVEGLAAREGLVVHHLDSDPLAPARSASPPASGRLLTTAAHAGTEALPASGRAAPRAQWPPCWSPRRR